MAQDRLTIDSGDTYTIPTGETQEYYGATVEGQLDLSESDSSLRLIDNPESDTYGDGTATETAQPQQPSSSPISLPLEIDFTDMQIGNALFITLTSGLLLGAVGLLRNYAAGIMLMLALFTLVVSGLLGLGLEAFWAMIAATVLLLIVGMVVRWSQ